MLSAKVTSSATRPRSAISASESALLRRVFRRTLRDHRARLGDEHAVAEPPFDDDVPPGLEEIGHGARVDDRNGRHTGAADVTHLEAEALRVRVPAHGPEDLPSELHLARVTGELTRANRRVPAA